MVKYPAPTKSFIDGGDDFEELDMSRAISSLLVRFIGKTTVAVGGGTPLYDAHPSQQMKRYRIGSDGNYIFDVKGRDLEWVLRYLNKEPSKITVIPAGAGADQDIYQKCNIPIGLNPLDLVKPGIWYDYNSIAVGIGAVAEYTAFTSQIKTRVNYVTKGERIPNLKVATNLNAVNLSSAEGVRIPLQSSGRLKALLFIARNAASPFARNTELTDVSIKLMGNETIETDLDEMQSDYNRISDTTELDGIGLIDFDDENLPMVGDNCYAYVSVPGATATNITIIEMVRPTTAIPRKPTPSPQVGQQRATAPVRLQKPTSPLMARKTTVAQKIGGLFRRKPPIAPLV
jgi:hypothetical protein